MATGHALLRELEAADYCPFRATKNGKRRGTAARRDCREPLHSTNTGTRRCREKALSFSGRNSIPAARCAREFSVPVGIDPNPETVSSIAMTGRSGKPGGHFRHALARDWAFGRPGAADEVCRLWSVLPPGVCQVLVHVCWGTGGKTGQPRRSPRVAVQRDRAKTNEKSLGIS